MGIIKRSISSEQYHTRKLSGEDSPTIVYHAERSAIQAKVDHARNMVAHYEGMLSPHVTSPADRQGYDAINGQLRYWRNQLCDFTAELARLPK